MTTTHLRIWRAIDDAYEAREPMPTVRELAAACGVSSISVVRYNLLILERARIIQRDPLKSRAIRLLIRYSA